MASYPGYSTLPEVLSSEGIHDTDYRPPVPPKAYPAAGTSHVGAKPSQMCCDCERYLKTWKCVQCDDSFCDDCWPKQRPHKPGKVGIDGRQHEKVDEEVIQRLKQIFGQPTPEEQYRRHGSDINTTWFGVDKEANQPFLHYSNRLVDILQESQVESSTERFPQLVSFVGQTGAGKSTVIKMLINRAQARKGHTHDYPAPVPGLVGDNVPTTGDVHLYADPGTFDAQKPILYADCEGMTGGENAPRGLTCREKIEGAKKPTQLMKNKLRKRLTWANDPKMQTREYAVGTLFPRILYTFSDVVVFVLREVRVFQTEVLKQLVHWAAMSIDKSINQPSLPHIIIVLNATESSINEGQWDPEAATRDLLVDYKDSVYQVPALRDVLARLAAIGKEISNTKELLEYYYSSVTVIRIPSKGRYMKIDDQVGKLYDIISSKCARSHADKKKIRMLLNTEKLPRYVNSAYDHFSQRLDEPFDFVEEARRHTPLPQDFGGHVLNLILSIYNNNGRANRRTTVLMDRLSPLIASCIMLAATRDNTQGTYSSLLWNSYYEPLHAAFTQFCNQWLRCSFQRDGFQCCNARNSHTKGHQAPSGKIFARGMFQSVFEPDDFFRTWIDGIDKHIKSLNERQQRADGEERDLIPRIHKDVMAEFYRDIGAVSKLKSHLTCLCCVRKIPENALPCGHIICKPCIQSFSKSMGQGYFELDCCPLHPRETRWPRALRIRFKPQDAGVRVLCLDGGGVRGIVELVILRAIERELGGFISVQNFFDLIVGTSTGGIIALGLGVKHWSVGSCMEDFRNLCEEAFTSRHFKKLAIVSHKSYYKTKPLEGALQSAFDHYSLLYGGSKPTASTSIRVAITSTSASENRPVIMTNYNTEGDRDSLPYKFVRPQDPSSELKIWEAARATAAAPPYFKPYIHGETATAYTDGAIHHNCPVMVADYERRLLWEENSDWSPDICLSIGSGFGNSKTANPTTGIASPEPAHSPRSKGILRYGGVSGLGYMLRTVGTIIDDQFNCEEIWKKYVAKAVPPGKIYNPEDKRRNIRINVDFSSERPSLDDVENLDSIERHAEAQVRENTDIHEVAHRLVASCFYFEKQYSCLRKRETGEFECRGHIRCRFNEGSREIKGLGNILFNCIRGSRFMPYFYLQENYNSRDQRNHEVPIPLETIEDMCNRRVFQLPTDLQINGVNQSSLTRLALCLQPDYYRHSYNYDSPAETIDSLLSISGFPRELCSQDSLAASDPDGQGECDHEEIPGISEVPAVPVVLEASSDSELVKLQRKTARIFNLRSMGHMRSKSHLKALQDASGSQLSVHEGKDENRKDSTDTNSAEFGGSSSSSRSRASGEEGLFLAELPVP